jgi:hypothetical protein
MIFFRSILTATFVVSIVAIGKFADASVIPYPTPEIENPIQYMFTALSTGTINAYFAGSTAGFMNDLTMRVNGIPTGVFGLNNQTSAYGDLFAMGSVNAGDTIVFEMRNLIPGGVGPWFSDQSLNSDGVNHIYSVPFAGDASIPPGIYVAFEDLPGGGDFNYNDENFVFTNVAVSVAGGIPEPGMFIVWSVLLVTSGFLFSHRGAYRFSSPAE